MGGMGKEQKAGAAIRELDDPFKWALRDAVEEPYEGEVRTQVGDVDSTPARVGLANKTVGSDARGGIELLGASDNSRDVTGLLMALGVVFGDGGGSGCRELVVSGGRFAGEDRSGACRGCNSGELW